MTTTTEKTCLVCNNSYAAKSARSKFCSEACKQRNKRDRQEKDFTQIVREPLDVECPSKYKIDREYFKYRADKGLETTIDDTVYTRDCLECDKSFKTQLELMRYCSFKCHTLF